MMVTLGELMLSFLPQILAALINLSEEVSATLAAWDPGVSSNQQFGTGCKNEEQITVSRTKCEIEAAVVNAVNKVLCYQDELANSDVFRSHILKSNILDLAGKKYDQLICIGLGNVVIDGKVDSYYQLALVLLMAKHAGLPNHKISLWDPCFTKLDTKLFDELGIHSERKSAYPNHRNGCRCRISCSERWLRSDNTLFFLPNCPPSVLSCFAAVCAETKGSCIICNDILDTIGDVKTPYLDACRLVKQVLNKGLWMIEPPVNMEPPPGSRKTPAEFAFANFSIQRPAVRKN